MAAIALLLGGCESRADKLARLEQAVFVECMVADSEARVAGSPHVAGMDPAAKRAEAAAKAARGCTLARADLENFLRD